LHILTYYSGSYPLLSWEKGAGGRGAVRTWEFGEGGRGKRR